MLALLVSHLVTNSKRVRTGKEFSLYSHTDEMNSADFLKVSAKRLAVIGVLILLPFATNNFIQGRLAVGFGSLAITIILAFNAWRISQGRDAQKLIFYVLMPGILFFMYLTFQQQGVIGAFWCYPAAVSFYVMLPERRAWISNVLLLIVVALCSGVFLELHFAARVVATLFAVSIFTAIFVRVIYGQQEKLKSLIATDPLTGLLNRTLLQTFLEDAVAQSRRNGAPASLIAFDIDYFKSINDRYGHSTGDKVLVGMGELMRESFRKSDKLFRLGGEEFLVLLYNTNSKDAWQVAEEFRNTMATKKLIAEQVVTVSVGVVELEKDMDWQQWLRQSDDYLYKAKEAGRNRTVV